MFRYLSLCSGIEAATVAWHTLGWKPFGFSEIEDFPAAVLAHHYGSNLLEEKWPDNAPPNFGDMTKFEDWPDAVIDVLVGGTPCQDFSIAGLRAGLDGIRGSLTLTYAAIARRYRPNWLVWENVPGVFSSNGGRDFASLLGLLCGKRIEIPPGGWKSAGIVPGNARAYGLAWRVLDAQFIRVDGYVRAVPQRRRRVFVVGYLGDWRRAAAVLFERESMYRNPPPRRKSKQGSAATISARTQGGGGLGTDFDLAGGLIASSGDVSHCLNAGGMGRLDYETETMIVHVPPTMSGAYAGVLSFSEGRTGNVTFVDGDGSLAPTLTTGVGKPGEGFPCIAHTLTSSGSDGLGFGIPNGPVFVDQDNDVYLGKQVPQHWSVRRLMPIECERLQGFPDNYTFVPFRGKTAADGSRYKALGNSMAVNVMRWIGKRIAFVSTEFSDT